MEQFPQTRNQPAQFLVRDNGADIDRRIEQALSHRLSASECYSMDEIAEVSSVNRPLFPTDFELDLETHKRTKVLCELAYCGLPKFHDIRSHRKIIGPLIVAAKRLQWRFLRSQLADTFTGIQEFASWMTFNHCEQLVKIRELEKRLKHFPPQ